MLVQALEELRQTLSKKEQQAVYREDMFRGEIEDLQRRYQVKSRCFVVSMHISFFGYRLLVTFEP
jgi:hypothetical protein